MGWVYVNYYNDNVCFCDIKKVKRIKLMRKKCSMFIVCKEYKNRIGNEVVRNSYWYFISYFNFKVNSMF